MTNIAEILKIAMQNHGAGRLEQAEELYQQVLQAAPNHPAALHSLAMIASQRGKYDTAIDLAGKAIKEMPEVLQFHNTIGAAFKASGKLQEAADAYKQAILLKPDYAQAYHNLAEILQSQGLIDEAIENYKHVIRLKPGMAGLYYNLAIILNKQGRISEAIENYKKAIHLKPDFTEAYYNLANILRAQNRTDEAIDNYKQAIRLKPELIKAYNALGEILNERNCYAETIELLKQAIQFNPDNSEVYNNMAATLMMQGHYSQALKNFKHSIKLTPGYAKTHANMGLLLLLTGQFIDGWKEYQWRLDPEVNVIQGDFDQPRWDGSSFAGKRLLVNHEQGFGDTLQFIRYLPMVKDRGGTVIFRERKSVLALLGQFPGIDEFSEVTTDAPPKINFDYHVSLLSLPGIFATTLETIPAEVPYLYADPAKAEYWRKKLCGTEFKVGIVWAGTAKHKNDHNRSCKLEDFAVLARIDGVRLYGLQKGKIATEVENLSEDIDITNLGEEFEDFADTAAAIENLDLIISVDTAVAHLAGAMGKPVWILLPFTPDWRWMLERQDSPWYPTAKLFRQEIHGDWDEVLNRVATKLRSLV